MVHVVASRAYIAGSLDPRAIHALAARALLANSTGVRGRARCCTVRSHNGVRVALGAVPDVLREENFRELDESVLEADEGEFTWINEGVPLCVALQQPRKVHLVHQRWE